MLTNKGGGSDCGTIGRVTAKERRPGLVVIGRDLCRFRFQIPDAAYYVDQSFLHLFVVIIVWKFKQTKINEKELNLFKKVQELVREFLKP